MSKVTVNPYVFFRGNCKEAMEFYKSVFGGELDLKTYKEAGIPNSPMPDDKIMHAELSAENITLMASDTAKASAKAAKVTICYNSDDEESTKEIFNKLSSGGEILNPLKKEFWGDIFGNFVDKYGVEWMFNVKGSR